MHQFRGILQELCVHCLSSGGGARDLDSGVGRRDDNKAVKQRLAPQEDACKLLMRVLDIRKVLKHAAK